VRVRWRHISGPAAVWQCWRYRSEQPRVKASGSPSIPDINTLTYVIAYLLNTSTLSLVQVTRRARHDIPAPAAVSMYAIVKFVLPPGEQHWDIQTHGLTGQAALRTLTSASTIALLGQSGQCPTSMRWRQTNKRTNEQKNIAIA